MPTQAAQLTHTVAAAADPTAPAQVLTDLATGRIIDDTTPVGVLLPSGVGTDDEATRRLCTTMSEAFPPGSRLAIVQIAGTRASLAAQANETFADLQLTSHFRTVRQVSRLLAGLRPVRPGLVDVARWRPHPHQPPLPRAPEPLAPYLATPGKPRRLIAYGGVLHPHHDASPGGDQ